MFAPEQKIYRNFSAPLDLAPPPMSHIKLIIRRSASIKATMEDYPTASEFSDLDPAVIGSPLQEEITIQLTPRERDDELICQEALFNSSFGIHHSMHHLTIGQSIVGMVEQVWGDGFMTRRDYTLRPRSPRMTCLSTLQAMNTPPPPDRVDVPSAGVPREADDPPPGDAVHVRHTPHPRGAPWMMKCDCHPPPRKSPRDLKRSKRKIKEACDFDNTARNNKYKSRRKLNYH